jgi:hypothetical protein
MTEIKRLSEFSDLFIIRMGFAGIRMGFAGIRIKNLYKKWKKTHSKRYHGS